MKSILIISITIAALCVTSCKKRSDTEQSEQPSERFSLINLAQSDSEGRIVKDVQGNVVELDLRGLRLSDEFVDELKVQELKSLQILKLSGEYITDQTINRLHGSQMAAHLRKIVFEDTSIENPESHPWVKQLREDFGIELTFTSTADGEQGSALQSTTHSESKSK